MLETMKMRAGLLLECAPEVYAFPHRTFQEYLAGAYLVAHGDFAQQAARLAAQGAAWREVVLLGVGRLVHLSGDTDKPLALVGELCPEHPMATEVAWRQAWLAGDVLLEMGRNRVRDSALGRDLDERVRRRLVALLSSSHLSPVERAAAGNTLARLGDPRFRADAWYLPAEPLLGFVEIPEGPFLMGSDRQHDSLAYDDEEPQHTVIVPPYYIARYLVTVAQWQAFVETSGYTPADAHSLQGIPNHPVVYVDWHDALAYCEWLTLRLREWPATPTLLAHLLRQEGWCVTLPSEAAWEKAARGTDGRRYPWGHEPEPHRANYGEIGIDTTNAVGCFPDGASPYGVEEISGNVLEWTRSLWGPDWNKLIFPYPYNPDDGREQLQAPDDIRRGVRGGAFWRVRQGTRCAARHASVARDVRHLGFRVVVRPCL
jgi:formylglycine-generating enzyme required for sulfatase activity